MADATFQSGGYIQIPAVTFNGTPFEAGSSISWTTHGYSLTQLQITDVNGNGELVYNVDTLGTSSSPSINGTFSGYTITGGDGVDYPVFYASDFDTYYVPVSATTAFATLANDGMGIPTSGTSNTFQSPEDSVYLCFGASTRIATPAGETTVESLQIGDLVVTADGRAVPVKWIGRQTVQKLFAGDRARPVRVAAGALGPGLPYTDLILTADHALIIHDLAINAGALVNGTTITLEPLSALPERVTYYHIETEDHDIILANGAPAETLIDYVGRQAFDNYAEYIDLYGSDRVIHEMPLPRISSARLVPPALKARLASVAAA